MELTGPAGSGFAEIPALLLEDFFGIGAASKGDGIGEIAHPATQQIGQVELAVFGPDLLDFLAGKTVSAATIGIGLPRAVQVHYFYSVSIFFSGRRVNATTLQDGQEW
jgi:hypothetical protein